MNKSKVYSRFFMDIDKETKWLNDLSEKGYMLVKKDIFTYEFIESDEKHTYYIDQRFFRDDYGKFCDFLQEVNIEFVTKKMGWYYFSVVNYFVF